MIALWILLGLLGGVACWISGWLIGHQHASNFAKDVVDRQLGEVRDYRTRRTQAIR